MVINRLLIKKVNKNLLIFMKINILLFMNIIRLLENILIKKLILLNNGLKTRIKEIINKLFLNRMK